LFGFAHVGCEGEDSACRLSTKNDGGESDEELENGVFVISNKIAAVPVSG
jgi:hypothetical protein